MVKGDGEIGMMVVDDDCVDGWDNIVLMID